MKSCKLLLILSVLMILASSVFGECLNQPKDGIYTTSGGSMIGGRASEAWCTGVGPGRPGNTENAMSWDGAILGGQWKVWGQAIDANGAVETGRNLDGNGNGWIDYQTTYTGGQFWLSGSGAWGNGTGDFTGTVAYYNVDARVSYLNGQAVGVTSNIYMTGVFDGCTQCRIEYAISNALLVWQTGSPGSMPADYPSFLCDATQGELYDVCCAVAKVYCTPAGVDSKSWGEIKELYK
jgi:hypothetical protein